MTCVSLYQLVLPLLLGGSGEPPRADPPAVSPAEVDGYRRLMSSFEYKEDYKTLVRMGTAAFPAFEVIVTDPKSDPLHVARAFGVLIAVDADRRRFIEPAVERLTDPDTSVRLGAAGLLCRVGSEADRLLVLPLLDDHDVIVRTGVAKDLAAGGGKRTLRALDVWLWVAEVRDHVDPDHFVWVREQRDALAKRLKAAPPKADAPPKK